MIRLVPLLLLACGCPHRPAPGDTPPMPPEQIAAILDSLAIAAGSLTPETPEACAAAVAVGSGLTAAAAVVREGGAILPPLSVDVSGCGLALGDGSPEAIQAGPAVDALLGVALVASASVRDCEARVWLGASVAWLRGAAPAIIAEAAEPSGSIEIPAAGVDLGGCRAAGD